MLFVTDFADQAVATPVALAVAAVLVIQGNLRQAAVWSVVVTSSFGLVLALKLFMAACGPVPETVFGGPSGHTVAGTIIYGGLLALLGIPAWVTVLASSVLAVLVGWSRIALGAHSALDVLLGIAIGTSGVAALAYLIRRLPARQATAPSRTVVVGVVLVLVLLLHGQRLRAEPVIRGVAQSYVRALLGCVADPGPARMTPR